MKMFIEERRQTIMEYLTQHTRATVKELAEYLSVSEATLRTDLKEMEIEGLLQRTHGGATLLEQAKVELGSSFAVREKKNQEEKIAICKQATDYIRSGQCILLDASSTSLELARILKKMPLRLTILTNGMFTAMELQENPNFTVIMIGGILRLGGVGTEGNLGNAVFNQINVDTMFTSASGFTLEDGLTDFNVYEVELKKSMIKASSKLIALLDYSKLGKTSIASFASLDQIDLLITNNHTDPVFLRELKKQNIDVVLASSEALD
jgi:DeoR/GlpR family transcriptional regulator of sugar metabolism